MQEITRKEQENEARYGIIDEELEKLGQGGREGGIWGVRGRGDGGTIGKCRDGYELLALSAVVLRGFQYFVFFYHQANKDTPDEDKMTAYYYEICLQCRIKTNLSLFVTMTDLNTDCCCVYCTLFKNVENYFVPNFIEVVERTGC